MDFELTDELRATLAQCAVTQEDLDAVQRVCRAATAYASAYEDAARFYPDPHRRRWLDSLSSGIDIDSGDTADFHFTERDGGDHESYYFMLADLLDPVASIQRTDSEWHAKNDARLEQERARAAEAAQRAEDRDRAEYERLQRKFG